MSNSLTITRGDTQVYASQITGTPDKALNGSTIRAMFRRSASSAVLFTKTLGAGIAITSDVANNRAISMTLIPADTASLNNGDKLLYDVEIAYADGVVRTVESGTFNIITEFTYP